MTQKEKRQATLVEWILAVVAVSLAFILGFSACYIVAKTWVPEQSNRDVLVERLEL